MQSVYLSAKWLHHFSKCSEKCFTASLLHRPITDRYHFRASSLIVITSSLHNWSLSLQGFITDRYHFITSSLHRVIKIKQPRNGFMAFGKLQFTFFRIYKICNWSCRPRNEERKIKNGSVYLSVKWLHHFPKCSENVSPLHCSIAP
jgi:hypothetical protein